MDVPSWPQVHSVNVKSYHMALRKNAESFRNKYKQATVDQFTIKLTKSQKRQKR